MNEHCVATILRAACEKFLYENNCDFNSYRFIYKLAFSPVSFYRMKEEVDCLVMKNVSVFIYSESTSTSEPYRI